MDQGAETITELCSATGWSQPWVLKYARQMVECGKWEMVWKKNSSNHVIRAYRTVPDNARNKRETNQAAQGGKVRHDR